MRGVGALPTSLEFSRLTLIGMADVVKATDPVEEEDPTEKVTATKRGGRPKKGSRPKIDIDDEIDEANRLAEVTKKMMHAAKAAQRNSRRSKQRLVRKAGKLSAADLERIATLKRCGLFVPDPTQPSSSSTTSVADGSSSTMAESSSPVRRRINSKLFSVVGQVPGASDLLASMQQHVPGCLGTAASDGKHGVSRDDSDASVPRMPRGRRLMPGMCTSAGSATSSPRTSAERGRCSSPVMDQENTEDGDDETAM